MAKTTKKQAETDTSRLFPWGYDTFVTPEQFIDNVTSLIAGSLQTLQDLEGDMYLSDYRNCVELSCRLQHAKEHKADAVDD